jgi:hypothetical protein
MKSGIKEGMEQNPVDEEQNPSNISEEVMYGNLSRCSAARRLPSPFLCDTELSAWLTSYTAHLLYFAQQLQGPPLPTI